MIFARFAIACTALLLSGGAFTASASEADRVDARFEVFGLAGLHVLTNRTSVAEAGNRYAIATDLDTRGLASIFVDLTSHSEAHGALAGETLRPEAYRAEVRRNSVDLHYGLDYQGDGTVINSSTPSSAKNLPLVAAQQVRGSVDQLTAYLLLERQLASRGTCALVVPVFDGSGLYNLRFTDINRDLLTADGHQNFAGPAQLCEVVREEIAANPNKNEDTYRRGKIWYARLVAGDRMIPVRMEFDTAFGGVTGYLAELRGHGVHLHLLRE